MNELYRRIESECNDLEVKVGQMCAKIGVGKSILSDLKNGRKQGLSTDTLEKIATFLDVSVDYLIGKEDMPPEVVQAVRERIFSLIDTKGLNQAQISRYTGISPSIISSYKVGKSKGFMARSKLTKIASALGTTVDYLLTGEIEKTTAQKSSGDILDEVDIAFYDNYKELAEEDKEILRGMVRLMRERRGK